MSKYVDISNMTPSILYMEVNEGELFPVIAATYEQLKRAVDYSVEHVVHCEECKYWHPICEDEGRCETLSLNYTDNPESDLSIYTEPDGFCSFGVNKLTMPN